jgi:hypothetical protein
MSIQMAHPGPAARFVGFNHINNLQWMAQALARCTYDTYQNCNHVRYQQLDSPASHRELFTQIAALLQGVGSAPPHYTKAEQESRTQAVTSRGHSAPDCHRTSLSGRQQGVASRWTRTERCLTSGGHGCEGGIFTPSFKQYLPRREFSLADGGRQPRLAHSAGHTNAPPRNFALVPFQASPSSCLVPQGISH